LPTHEENALAFSRSLRAFHYNQQVVLNQQYSLTEPLH
jgi:hypothetical protein